MLIENKALHSGVFAAAENRAVNGIRRRSVGWWRRDERAMADYDVRVPGVGGVVEFSVSLFAYLAVDSNDVRLDHLLDALIADPRALGGGCISHGPDDVGTIFRVEVLSGDGAIANAAAVA